MSGLAEVKNMKEMRESLQDYLLKTTDEEEEEEKKNDKKIKTYIIESNIRHPKEIPTLPNKAQLSETSDQNLVLMKIPTNLGYETIYFDASDPRFWLAHTTSESGEVADFINKLVTHNHSFLDYSWFSSNFLERKCDIGYGAGFGLKFENSFLKNGDDQDEKYLKRFSMLFWGGRPSEVLTGLKNNPGLVSGVTLSRVKRVLKTEAGYVKETIYHNGKFTLTKGDSIDSHFLAIDQVKNKYADLINRIEKDYRINYKKTDAGFKVEGTYSLIRFQKRIEDLNLFLKNFVSCTKPFRLFGIPQFVDKDFVKISAVDLHTYDKFNMEISPDYIRVFLYKQSCGNILTRLMTNLQHFYDSQIELVGCDDEQLI